MNTSACVSDDSALFLKYITDVFTDPLRFYKSVAREGNYSAQNELI